MTIHPRAGAIDRLTNVDGNLIEVTKYVAADFVGQGTNGPPPKGQVDRHQLLRGDEPRRFTVNERGLNDTVRVNPNEIVELAVRFETFSGRYMYHCHILEHEDRDMMRPIVVMPAELMPFMS